MEIAGTLADSSCMLSIEALVRSHYDDVYRFCRRRLDDDLAADAVQETFISAQKALRKFEGRSAPKTWLLGIALNHCRRARRDYQPLQWLEGDCEGPSGESGLIARHDLRIAMKKLNSKHLEVVVLHELDGLTYEEVAAVLHVPVGTVKSRLYHAFVQLRALLDGEER